MVAPATLRTERPNEGRLVRRKARVRAVRAGDGWKDRCQFRDEPGVRPRDAFLSDIGHMTVGRGLDRWGRATGDEQATFERGSGSIPGPNYRVWAIKAAERTLRRHLAEKRCPRGPRPREDLGRSKQHGGSGSRKRGPRRGSCTKPGTCPGFLNSEQLSRSEPLTGTGRAWTSRLRPGRPRAGTPRCACRSFRAWRSRAFR